MGKVIILPETTRNPIQLIGQRAGYCWGADVYTPAANYKRGLDCLTSNHGRTFEFVNIEAVLDGYSARVIREWYTHIGGAPTRLQASTRYIDYNDFSYVTPPTISTRSERKKIFDETMLNIKNACAQLEVLGSPREDVAMLLPLGMTTKIVDKRNLRNVIDMSHQRMCTRAYWEFRKLFYDYITALRNISDEWEYIVEVYMKPKCEAIGYCPEKKTCGKMPPKEKI